MITSIEQCAKIQERRVAAGKRGYAKSVRTFVQNNVDRDSYKSTMKQFKVSWKRKDEDKASVESSTDEVKPAKKSKTSKTGKTSKKSKE